MHVIQHAQKRLKRHGATADGPFVIELHRIHGNGTFLVNADLIETIEARPDTTVTLVNKHRYVVEDSVADIIEKVVAFRARIAAACDGRQDTTAASRIQALPQEEERAA